LLVGGEQNLCSERDELTNTLWQKIFLNSAHRDLVMVCKWFISVTGYCTWAGGLGSLLYWSYILQMWGFWKNSIIFICPQVHCATVQGEFEHCLKCTICCVHGGQPGKNNSSYKEPVEIFNVCFPNTKVKFI